MRSMITRLVWRPLGIAAAVVAVSLYAAAPVWALGSRGDSRARARLAEGDPPSAGAPEIDAGTAGAALAILVGGLALLRHRTRR